MLVTFTSPNDAMRYTPDDSVSAREMQRKLGFPAKSSNKLRDAAMKINLAKMFSLAEGNENESPDFTARHHIVDGGRHVLSHFRDEEEAFYQLHAQEQQIVDNSTVTGTTIHTFSNTGFKLVGDTVKAAAETKSMLQLLRTYGNVDNTNPSTTTPVVPPQRFFGFDEKEHSNTDNESAASVTLGNKMSVLESLRNMSRQDFN